MAAESADCIFLEWDSDFWGRRIARLRNYRLTPDIVTQALDWTTKNSVDCLYFLADADDNQTVVLAEKNGFHQPDIRITLDRHVANLDRTSIQHVRVAREVDLTALRAIAANSHRDGRFYFDYNFDRAECDKFYSTWLENSFRGFR